METIITLEDINDLATVIQNWHSDTLMELENMYQQNKDNPYYTQIIQQVYELIKDLPYNTEYSINQNVMSV